MKKILVIALSTFCLMFTAYGHAEITFQGFASFVGGTTLDSKDDSYLGYINKIEYDNDSLYALQASSNLGDGLTVTGQIIARGAENYQPEFEWMYASYNLTPTLNMKIGRVRTPFYMFSEYLEVGYTYQWIRPPVEVYAAAITNMDGVSFLYNMPIGNIDSQYMITIGNREDFSNDPTATVSDYKPLIAANAEFEFGPYTTKLIYTQGDISFNSPAIDGATAALSTDTAFAKYATIKGSPVVFSGFAFIVDMSPIAVMFEFASIDFEELIFVGDETRMLAAFTYSLNDENAVTYSWSSNEKESETGLLAKLDGTNASIATHQFVVNGSLAAIDSEVTTHTLGYRHDFHDSAAAKIEFISTEDSKKDTEATLIRFGIDMLF